MSRWWSHPLLKSLIVAGYLLATTASGLFHDHGGAGHSCTSSCCGHAATSEQTPQVAKADQGGKCHHCSCKHHAAKKEIPAKPVVSSGHPDHGPCAVCQFLAQHHAVPVLEAPIVVVGPPPTYTEAVRALQLAAQPVSHPARGPPACA